MEIDELVRERASSTPGQNTRSVCPFCNATHEKSFDVKRDVQQPFKLWFNCYRGTCGVHGLVEDRAGARLILHGVNTQTKPDKPIVEHRKAPPSFLSYLAETYHIPIDTWKYQGVRYEPEWRTLCMPWLNHNQEQIGWVEKRLNPPEAGRKSHHDLCVRGQGRLAFPRIPASYHALGGLRIVLVEDLVSAYRINELKLQHTYAVALLGAQISQDDAHLIGQLATHALVLLDYDQWPRGALRVMKALKPHVLQVRATTLSVDPKAADEEELHEVLQET